MVQSYLFDLLDFLFPIRGAELWLSERPEARLSLSLSLSPTRPRSVSSWLSPPVSSSVSLSVCSRLLPSRFCSSLPLERRRAKLRAFLTVFIERFLQHSQVRSGQVKKKKRTRNSVSIQVCTHESLCFMEKSRLFPYKYKKIVPILCLSDG